MSLSPSPIGMVPYDVLVDIFVHCLPEDPLEDYQPDTTVAPMLLCQICSSWRTVALTCPALWVHISFILTVSSIEIGESNPIEDSRWEVKERDNEFLRWWKNHQGQIAPYLHLRVQLEYDSEEFHFFPEDVLIVDRFEFLLGYISSAQYLNMEEFFWQQILRAIQGGSRVTFPNLHTLTRFSDSTQGQPQTIFCTSQMSIGLVPNRPPSLFRHLYIDEGELPDSFVIPQHWSTLTHIWLNNGVLISPNLWRSFIRSFPHLQWGYFKITQQRDRAPTKPARFVLTQLATLSINFKSSYPDRSISTLFDELYLPTLRTLALMSHTESWKDRRALSHISAVLQSSAPNITTLSLGHGFLSLSDQTYNPINLSVKIEPIWKHAPHLEHLQFELYNTYPWTTSHARETWNIFIRNAFETDAKWSDLTHPACPIRTITLSNEQYDQVEDFVTSKIRELNEKIPNIDFKISSESPSRMANNIWRQWGSRL